MRFSSRSASPLYSSSPESLIGPLSIQIARELRSSQPTGEQRSEQQKELLLQDALRLLEKEREQSRTVFAAREQVEEWLDKEQRARKEFEEGLRALYDRIQQELPLRTTVVSVTSVQTPPVTPGSPEGSHGSTLHSKYWQQPEEELPSPAAGSVVEYVPGQIKEQCHVLAEEVVAAVQALKKRKQSTDELMLPSVTAVDEDHMGSGVVQEATIATPDELSTLQKRISELQRRLDSSSEKNENMHAQVDMYQEELAEAHAQIRTLQLELRESTAKTGELEGELSNLHHLQGTRLNRLSAQLSAREQDVESLRTELETARAEISRLKSQPSSASAQQDKEISMSDACCQEGGEAVPEPEAETRSDDLQAMLQQLRVQNTHLTVQLAQQRRATQQALTWLGADKRDKHLISLRLRQLRGDLTRMYSSMTDMELQQAYVGAPSE